MLRKLLSHNQMFWGAMTALTLVIVASCASVGTPGGGWYDETPPALKKSTPAQGATNVKTKKIQLHFNENVKLDKANEKLVVSPPQRKAPLILSNAKTVTVELMDSLIPNTTYSLDFGDAIADNNEGNPLEQFSLTFSTGPTIDSLKVSGILLNAEDLEPVTGAFVGIYPDTLALGDSAIFQVPMTRAGKTDAYGRFTISGIGEGRYKVFALQDGNSNYFYDLGTESVAFLDSVITPAFHMETVYDTAWTYNHEVDSIWPRETMVCTPNDLQLRLFNEGKSILYMDASERPDSSRLTFRFSGKMPELPSLKVLKPSVVLDSVFSFDEDSLFVESHFVVEPNPTLDTLTYWIADSSLVALDTLKLAVTYYYTDTLNQEVLRTDMLKLTRPVVRPASTNEDKSLKDRLKGGARRGKKKAPTAADSIPPIRYVNLSLAGGNKLDIGKRPMFESNIPLSSVVDTMIHLEEHVDTLWNAIPFRLEQDSMKVRRFSLSAIPHFKPGSSYRLVVDSAAVHDLYGAPNQPTNFEFSFKKPEDYAHLLFRIQGIDGPAFVQLLNEKDVAVQQARVENGVAKFVNVPAGKYSARLVVDKNNNNRFDAGNLALRQQPEEVFYLNMILELRANWQFSQEWDPRSVELSSQKPEELKKNKPKEKTQKKSKNEEYYRKLGIDPITKQKIKD